MENEIAAEVIVAEKVARSLPRNPEALRECVTKAEQSMNELAAERGRRVAERPRYIDAHDTGLGYVRLEFRAATAVR